MAQFVDTETAKEFMKEALGRISPEELTQICADLERKGEIFLGKLGPGNIYGMTEDDLYTILRSVFSTRRKARKLLENIKFENLKDRIAELLYSDGEIRDRFQNFYDSLECLESNIRFDLASEILHYTFPRQYWLWTRWIWDPKTKTGALPLVITEDYNLEAAGIGETYLKLGKAIAFIHHVGEAAEFEIFKNGPFAVDVYLSCVYVVYVYTVLRMRMTQEFNKVVPGLGDFSRRLLGIYKLEEEKYAG
jgi:hypothetical protein